MEEHQFNPNGFVALITDFGLQDDYVGLMHAAVSRVNPALRIVNLCHEVMPGNIEAASFLLERDAPFFPEGTVFVCVVDPGVGSNRAMIAARIESHLYIAPDNGLLDPLLSAHPDHRVRRIENKALFGPAMSSTFHGRDIFAPVAAHLASDIPFEQVGPKAEEWVKGESLKPVLRGKQLHGKILWVDRFGNLVTNIDHHEIEGYDITVSRKVLRQVTTFSEGAIGETVWMIGSKGTVEIVVNNGSASKLLGIGFGHPVIAAKSA